MRESRKIKVFGRLYRVKPILSFDIFHYDIADIISAIVAVIVIYVFCVLFLCL